MRNSKKITLLLLTLTSFAVSEIAYGISGVFALGAASTDVQQNISTTSGVELVSVSPNPFNPVVTIRVVSSNIPEVSIFSSNGKMLLKSKTSSKGELVWNASSYPSGLYIVKVNTGNKQFSKMLTLMK
ncbi:MAG: T9SS type A sorting domain-containing protein [Fibrobacteres bacterium]|nr:T9SS type A sorting domain-containing protein [Fibrobacterota bacterium]